MLISERNNITSIQARFLNPTNSTHRQYEALRAFYVDKITSSEAARCFGYSPGSFRVLCHQFLKEDPVRQFFLPPQKGPQAAPKRDPVRQTVTQLRKQNLSVYDIQRVLAEKNTRLSTVSIAKILNEEGFAKLPRRSDDERPQTTKPDAAEVADVNQLDFSPRSFTTKFGGLFLFCKYLNNIPLHHIADELKLPGSSMIPAPHAIRALLALKLFGNARHGHVMSYVFDEGPALFAGLNVMPKRSFLAEYSCRVDPRCFPKLNHRWFDAVAKIGLHPGTSFDLDFHTIPFYGDDSLVEKHYIPRRSHRQKGMLIFFAHDADNHVFCYANAAVSKADQNDEILRFVEHWKQRTGKKPQQLIFDSKLTTYANLNQLNKMQIQFTTIRRRTDKLLDDILAQPSSAWRRIELKNIAREYRRPRILDSRIELNGYDGPIRQIAVRDLGHEEPTILLTNQLKGSATTMIDRYAKRMVIENAIADGIDFFHIDALSSSVALKVDFDAQLTLMASTLYRLLARDIGAPYDTAKTRRIFRDFIDASAHVSITESHIIVRYQKRAHNPLLKAAGLNDSPLRIPWLGGKSLVILLG
jgi:hypothetical protein